MSEIVVFLGILSAYCFGPTVGTIRYQQEVGRLPQELPDYDFYIAVDDCNLVGHEATMYSGDLVFDGMVMDCAGANGAHFFSDGNDLTTPYKLVGDVDWFFWELHPDIVRTLVRIEVQR